MSKCLLTTLKESVENGASLCVLGELRVKILPNSNVTNPAVATSSSSELTLTIEGDGYFTDATGTANLGKTVTAIGYNQYTYLSVGEYWLKIISKYDINGIKFLGKIGQSNNQPGNFVVLNSSDWSGMKKLTYIEADVENSDIDLDDIGAYLNKDIVAALSLPNPFGKHGVKGNLSSLEGFNNLSMVSLSSNTDVTGDINSLNDTNMTYLTLWGARGIDGSLSSTLAQKLEQAQLNGCINIEGNLSVFANSTKIVGLYVQETKFTGNISSLSDCTNLQVLDVSNTAITGDTSSLANLTNLTTFNYTNTAITGTWPLT